jgi:hypothetical protein
LINYNKEFEIELYTNIDNGYIVINELFHAIEFENFHLGINFANKIAGEKIKNTILHNSIILNSNVSLYKLNSLNELEIKKQRTNNRSDLIVEILNTKQVTQFEISSDGSNIVLIINQDEFEKMGIYSNNYESHYKKVKNSLSTKNEDIVMKKPERRSQFFVDYNALKRKTVMPTTELPEEKRKSHVKFVAINEQPLCMSIYDEIKLAASRVKPVKNIEKKPLHIICLSNNPQLQMGLKQLRRNISKEEEEDTD